MKSIIPYAQLYLRLAVGLGFLAAFADRLGWVGIHGDPNIAWGSWRAFLDYTFVLLGFLPRELSDICGLLATVAEGTIGLMLIIGFKTRIAAAGSTILSLLFALAMCISLGPKSTLNYSVFTLSAASLLLYTLADYPWSVDKLFKPKRIKSFQ